MAKIQDSFQKTLEVKEPLRLEVETGSGDMAVRRGREGRLLVFGEFQVRARSEEEARRIAEQIVEDPPIEVAGDLVRIGDLSRYDFGPWPFGPSVMIDLTIEAPAETAAHLSSGSGDQEVKGLRGPIRADAGSGDVEIEAAEADIKVDTGSGDIAVARVRGGVEADAGSGDIELEKIAGRAAVDVGSGDLHLKEMGSDIAVDAGSGDITVESAIGDHARWALEAGSGDVSLLLPRDSQFELRAEIDSGEVESDLPLTVSGKVGKRVDGR
ncbi:MAG: DUF4097 domain-containing protein, partial [Candidatus Bipolaricaulia bacterium]